MSPSAYAEIHIATVGPMKGQYAALGEQLRRDADQAVADINAAGGVNGEQLVLDAEDNACDPKQAIAVANQLVAKGVKFVTGHYYFGSSIAAAKIYEAAGIILISPSSTNPKLTDEGGLPKRQKMKPPSHGAIERPLLPNRHISVFTQRHQLV
jgi:branched-chain amino acid transport system substrate-binding protein